MFKTTLIQLTEQEPKGNIGKNNYWVSPTFVVFWVGKNSLRKPNSDHKTRHNQNLCVEEITSCHH